MTLEINIEKPAVLYCRGLLGADSCEKWGLEGWPDRMILLGFGAHFWWEFKAARGGFTPAQKIRIPRLRERGETIYVPRSLAEAVEQLDHEIRLHRR